MSDTTASQTAWEEMDGDLVLEKDMIVYRLRPTASGTYTLSKNGVQVVRGSLEACERHVPVPIPNEIPLLDGTEDVESEGGATDTITEKKRSENTVTVKLKRNRLAKLFRELGHEDVEDWTIGRIEQTLDNLPDDCDLGREYERMNDLDARETLSTIMEAIDKDHELIVIDDEKRGRKERTEDRSERFDDEEAKEDTPKTRKRSEPREESDNGKESRKSEPKAPRSEPKDESKPKSRGRPRKEDKKTPVAKFAFSMKENPKTLKVTKALAREFSEMEKWPNDRLLKKTKLEYFEDEIASDRFHGAEWASAYCEETKTTYRINGKHTSSVLADMFQAGKEIPEIYVTVKRFSCPTMEDVAGLFSVYDPKVAARNKNDVIRAYSGIDETTKKLTNRHLSVITAGLAYDKWGKSYRRVPPQVQAKLLLKESEFVGWVEDLLEGPPKEGKQTAEEKKKAKDKVKHLLRMSCVAAMSRTYDVSKKDSTVFWEGIRDDTDDPKNSPRRALFQWLRENTMSRGTGKATVSEWEVLYRCLQAWNAWRANAKNVNLETKLQEEGELPEAQ